MDNNNINEIQKFLDPEIVRVRMMVAQDPRFRRDYSVVKDKIIESLKDNELRSKAIYALPRKNHKTGKTIYIKGASIVLTKEIAMAFQHLSFGIHVITQTKDLGVVKSYCIDLQNNTSEERCFNVKIPQRWDSKKNKYVYLSSEEAYKVIYSESVKRMRACILHCIPETIQNFALQNASVPLVSSVENGQKIPEKTRFEKALQAFIDIQPQVRPEHLLEKVNKLKPEDLTNEDYIILQGIYNSMKDSFISHEDIKKIPEKKLEVKFKPLKEKYPNFAEAMKGESKDE